MQNFGKIKTVFNTILVEGIIKKNDDNKNLFKQYLNTIKESEILKTQFLVYNNIENKVEDNQMAANLYVNENIKLMEKYSAEDIISENKKLIAISTEIESKIGEDYTSELSDVHESLSQLIVTKRTPKTVDQITESMSNVINYIKNNKAKEVNEKIDLPISMVSSMFVDTYNKKYETLSESDKAVVRTIFDSTDEEKKELYSKTIRECIDLIDEKLKESDLEAKDKLLKVKDKLLNDKLDITENFISKISKLVELKSSLND